MPQPSARYRNEAVPLQGPFLLPEQAIDPADRLSVQDVAAAGTGRFQDKVAAIATHAESCRCGSGKTWSACNPGACPSPTFVITTNNFPKDKQLPRIPAPVTNDRSRAWQYAE